MLLREGMDPTVAITNLADLIGRLEGAGSAFARPGDWQTAQNGYLQVVETVERQLASLFEDDDGTAAGLFGEQYRMIREMSASTPRPEPLIGLEAGRQVTALQRLVSGVTALRALRDRVGVPVVLDTNVLMHYHRPDRVLWAEVIGSDPVRLVLPICVLDELDNKKYADSDRMSRRADMAVRALREHRGDLVPGSVATFADGTTCEVFLDDAGHVRKANPDEELLSRALTLQRALGRQVTVVTGDLGMQLRADAIGLAEAVMSEKYSKDAQRRKKAPEDEEPDAPEVPAA
jgi:hypothetical protein